jgi:hypothetical protein
MELLSSALFHPGTGPVVVPLVLGQRRDRCLDRRFGGFFGLPLVVREGIVVVSNVILVIVETVTEVVGLVFLKNRLTKLTGPVDMKQKEKTRTEFLFKILTLSMSLFAHTIVASLKKRVRVSPLKKPPVDSDPINTVVIPHLKLGNYRTKR